jgi:hypothetical protein
MSSASHKIKMAMRRGGWVRYEQLLMRFLVLNVINREDYKFLVETSYRRWLNEPPEESENVKVEDE